MARRMTLDFNLHQGFCIARCNVPEEEGDEQQEQEEQDDQEDDQEEEDEYEEDAHHHHSDSDEEDECKSEIGCSDDNDEGEDDDDDQDDREEQGVNAEQEGGQEMGEEDEEDEERETFVSRNGEIEWSSDTYHPCGSQSHRRGTKEQEDEGEDHTRATPPQSPGPTEYAATRVHDILSVFDLFVTPRIIDIALAATNLEGLRKFGNDWKSMDATDLCGYMGLLILAGVYRSRNEALESLWHEESGRAIFRATMPIKRFHTFSGVLRFDDRETRAARRASDKLAPIPDVWDEWARRLPRLYNPGPDVTVDEQLVPF